MSTIGRARDRDARAAQGVPHPQGRRVAVEDLDLAVPAGGVHGFLGPNGSGKTTTIRMLLGLARADAGADALFGEPVPRGAARRSIGRVGAVVEEPKFAPAFTGRQNLTLLADAIGAPAHAGRRGARAGRARRRAARTGSRSYSLGMKQRLAIAATLLKNPELLILDEPTNGLDPAGIREIRDTIAALGDRGTTVLLSCHILAEVQQVCRLRHDHRQRPAARLRPGRAVLGQRPRTRSGWCRRLDAAERVLTRAG